MNRTCTAIGLMAMLGLSAVSVAQRSSGAENGLLGVKLYDPAKRVLGLYGSPDEIQAVLVGGGQQAGPGGGGPGGFGGPGGPGGFGGPPGGGPGGGAGRAPSVDWSLPLFPENLNQLGMPAPPGNKGQGGGGGSPFGPGGSRPGGPPGGFGGPSGFPGGAPGGAPGGFGGPPGGAGGGFGGGAAERVQFTRWVYNRKGIKFSFVIDKVGNVLQIEAIGLNSPKVKTRRGVGFGTDFKTLFTKYSQPDGYEIAGDNLLVKYLTRSKVAFRLSRLAAKKPHVVTGIVIAAGKS